MPGLQLSHICPGTNPVQGGLMIGVFSAGFYMLSRPAADGRIARQSMAPRRRSIIGSIAGPGGKYGPAFFKPLSTRACWCTPHQSIPAMSKPIALPMVEKGGEKSGYRALARRPDDENPRINRPFGPSRGVNSNAGQYQRHRRCGKIDRGGRPCPAPDRRQRLRCGCASSAVESRGNHAHYPRPAQPQESHPIRQKEIQRPMDG